MPSLIDLLFNFEGRISRAEYWRGNLIMGLIAGLICFLAMAVLFTGMSATNFAGKFEVYGVTAAGASVLVLWVNAALQAKRWRDRGRSGWLTVIPSLIFLSWIGFIGYGLVAGQMIVTDFSAPRAARPEIPGEPLLFLVIATNFVALWTFLDLGLGGSAAVAGPSDASPGPKSGPTASWDVSGAEAALSKAIAERQSGGARPDEAWKNNMASGNRASARAAFGRRI